MKRPLIALLDLSFLSIITMMTSGNVVHAQKNGVSLGDTGVKVPENLPTLGLENVRDPIQATESLMVSYVINPILLVSGGVAVIIIMYASFQIISARGDEEKLEAAKTTLTWAFIGLGLIIASYTIVRNLAAIILNLS